MKKLITLCILFTTVALCFSAKNRIKDKITETKLGSFDEFETGSGTLKLKKLGQKTLASVDFTALFNPRKNTVGLCYKKLGLKEYLNFDIDARRAVVTSYNQYLTDYDAKKLDRKSKKFQSAYEAARAKVDWGAFSYSSSAQPKIEFSYIFVNKSPYFAIRVQSCDSTEKKGDAYIKYSSAMLYFTRSMAQDLIDAVSE